VAGLKQRSRKVITLALRQLLRFGREYPREPLLGAVREAARYGLYDLVDRLSRSLLDFAKMMELFDKQGVRPNIVAGNHFRDRIGGEPGGQESIR